MGGLVSSWPPRVTLIGFILVAVQTGVAPELRPFGVVIQVVLAFAAAAGAASGPSEGAMAGFVLGLMYDLGTGTPLGATAFTMTLAGYTAGWGRQYRIEPKWWILALLTMAGTTVGESAVPFVRVMIGETDVVSSRMLVVVPVVAVASGILSPMFVPLARWCLRIRPTELRLPADA
ncbi:MAG: rod shape-determining protein MreD [Actinomycetota bacterium]|nr:rod shape-determining protein MreD [Actinomycetota bacterium]